MRMLSYIIAVQLALLGLAMAVLGPGQAAYAGAPAKPVVVGAMLLVWGTLLFISARARYRGGTPSYLGAVLVGFGLWAGAGAMLWAGPAGAVQHALTGCALAGAGVLLLLYGHRIHVRVSNRAGGSA